MRLATKLNRLTFDLQDAAARTLPSSSTTIEERERERLDQENVVDDVEGDDVGARLREQSAYRG